MNRIYDKEYYKQKTREYLYKNKYKNGEPLNIEEKIMLETMTAKEVYCVLKGRRENVN